MDVGRVGGMVCLLILVACGEPPQKEDISTDLPRSGALAALSEAEFEALPADQQFRVINELLGALYKGVPVRDFFSWQPSFGARRRQADGWTPIRLFRALQERDPALEQRLEQVDQRYFAGGNRFAPVEKPLAVLYHLPPSRDYFAIWIAYQLANNIMFSPALELVSVGEVDVNNVFQRLYSQIAADLPITQIAEAHMASLENWRRFRSPEDNGREMLEIFLDRFNDAEVPAAAQACGHWYLSDDSGHFQLIKGLKQNRQPVELFGRQDIVECEDFYRAIAEHPDFMATVFGHVVAALFPSRPPETQEQIVAALLESNPRTFHELYLTLLFSRQFLFDNARLKNFEELFFNLASRLYWEPHVSFFDYLNRRDGAAGNHRYNLSQMHQSALFYKLGRAGDVPSDSLSFSYAHGALRYSLMLQFVSEEESENMGWRPTLYNAADVQNLGDDAFLDYLFLSLLSRPAHAAERDQLQALLREYGHEDRLARTRVVLDYLSRLPELYVAGEEAP